MKKKTVRTISRSTYVAIRPTESMFGVLKYGNLNKKENGPVIVWALGSHPVVGLDVSEIRPFVNKVVREE